jgi:DNA polymerase III epsilon subunit-like protein
MEEKIDFRHHYVLVLDTETANTLVDENGNLDMSNVLMYDCGWSVVDTMGGVYLERSYINKDIFFEEQELMQSAYYAKKIPQYIAEIESGKRIVSNTYEIRKKMLEDMEMYHITEVVAHNARFDLNALNVILRYVTKSKFRYWFPYGTEIWDTMKMARDVIHPMPSYRKFCEEFDLKTKNGRLSTTAESLYKFLLNDPYFEEEHTGLEDVQIEREIMFYCFRQHKPMRKSLFENKADPLLPPTELQKLIMRLVKENA